jgi:signal transduction histidine kinase
MNDKDVNFQVLVVDFEANTQGYRDSLNQISKSHFIYTDNYLQYIDLIHQKSIDAILVNIKLLIEQQPRDFNNVKKQLNEFRIPIFFFTIKSENEINIESALNTTVTTPESLSIQTLVLKIKEPSLRDMSNELSVKKPKTSGIESLTSNAESLEVNQQKAIFIRNITYEIRTLLNNVGGPLQMIKEKIDDPELIPFFGIIDSTLNRLVEFTFKANLLSDLKLGNYPIKKTKVNLEEIIRFTVLELTEFIELEKIKLTINAPDSKVNLYADKDLLFHCFTAILDKTISLTKDNGEIQIDFIVSEQQLDCKIRTSSITFPKQDILEIFNSVSIEQEIGLAFAKIVLNVHNGSYWVDMTQEKGITIGISFKTDSHE